MNRGSTIERGVVEYLRTVADVAAFVGARVFEDDLPDNADLPAVTVEANSFQDWGHLDGEPTNGTSEIVVDCLATDAETAARIRKAILTAMNGAGNVEWGGIHVQHCTLKNLFSDRPKQESLHGNAFCKRLTLDVIYDFEL